MKSKIIVDKGNCNVNTANLKKPGQVAVTLGKHPQNHRLIVSPLNNLGRVFGLGPVSGITGVQTRRSYLIINGKCNKI